MAYAAGSVVVTLVIRSCLSDDFHCLTVVQPSIIAAINNLPVVIDADQVIVCDEGKV